MISIDENSEWVDLAVSWVGGHETRTRFSDWPTIFPNATCATALIDRTVHHADVIAIEGDSYRRREAEADKKTRRTKKAA